MRNHLCAKAACLYDRRSFLSNLALAALAPAARFQATAASQSIDKGIRGFDFSSLKGPLTANGAFFIRNHFNVPVLNSSAWKLRVMGRVRTPLEVDYQELVSQRARSLTATVECAGNPVGGAGVSTATWSGIGLRELLEQAGLQAGVKCIRLVGADQGSVGESFGLSIPYSRSIPLDKALKPETLLAYQMNGVPLPAEHGYPLRALVAGWYGMDSVKWLQSVEALDHEDQGYFMTQRYVATRLRAVGSERRALTRMRVKSQIARPREGEILPLGPYSLHGAAWAGEKKVVEVEVSVDGGETWAQATLETAPEPYAWVLWSFEWVPKFPGDYTVTVRATDEEGTTQVHSPDLLRLDDYEDNWWHSVRCSVHG